MCYAVQQLVLMVIHRSVLPFLSNVDLCARLIFSFLSYQSSPKFFSSRLHRSETLLWLCLTAGTIRRIRQLGVTNCRKCLRNVQILSSYRPDLNVTMSTLYARLKQAKAFLVSWLSWRLDCLEEILLVAKLQLMSSKATK